MLEEDIPPVPTRQQELEYLDWFEKSISTDKWLTWHPRFSSAGPKRLRYKAKMEMKHEYRKTFLKNFILTASLAVPLSFL